MGFGLQLPLRFKQKSRAVYCLPVQPARIANYPGNLRFSKGARFDRVADSSDIRTT